MLLDKVLIVTLQDANYGNRLQNYALQECLKKLHFCTSNIIYKRPLVFVIIRNFVNKFKHIKNINKSNIQLRNRCFQRFNKEFILGRINVGFFNVRKIPVEEYCFAITGSDQVWHNWSRFNKWLEFFYLSFIPRKKRVAYAPSFGFSSFPKSTIQIHKDGIAGFESVKISIREQQGAELIKQLTGHDVPVVPDPTLLLYYSDWAKIAKKPKYNVPEHYVLQYFLGDAHQYNKNIPVIDIYNPTKEEWFTQTGPCEFIWLIQHCDYVCTDSFHACVFSIIFHRDFAIFHRKQNGMEGMFDRIDTLLHNTGLEQCIDNSEAHIINWSKVDSEIEKRREIGYQFLKNALGDGNIK